jgi:hypothetical protein
MEAWGAGNFENDDAGDWLFELEKSKDKSVINKALDSVLQNTGYIETPACCEALAAAEIISAGISGDHSGVMESVSKWLSKKPGLFKKPIAFDSGDVRRAIEVINKILESSELKEPWAESEQFEEWKTIESKLLEELSKFA